MSSIVFTTESRFVFLHLLLSSQLQLSSLPSILSILDSKVQDLGMKNQNPKADSEENLGKAVDHGSKSQPEPSNDYIHLRARRGQATDSHSLAERLQKLDASSNDVKNGMMTSKLRRS